MEMAKEQLFQGTAHWVLLTVCRLIYPGLCITLFTYFNHTQRLQEKRSLFMAGGRGGGQKFHNLFTWVEIFLKHTLRGLGGDFFFKHIISAIFLAKITLCIL